MIKTTVVRIAPIDLLFWCTTARDIELAKKLSSRLSATKVLILQRNAGVLDVSYVKGLKPSNTSFGSLKRAKDEFPLTHQFALIKLNDCRLLHDTLERLYLTHLKQGAAVSEAAFYPHFTDAHFEFRDYSKKRGSILEKEIIGPQFKDFEFYVVENFDLLFSEPKFLSVDLTRKCNKRCDKCMYHSPRTPFSIPSDESMPVELMRNILHQAAQFKHKPNIHPFLSGEPFLYEHLDDFFTALKELELESSITTNGILLSKKNIQRLLNSNITHVTISLDSMNQDTYTRLQEPGRLNKVIENIDCLLEEREKKKNLKVNLTFVVDHSNEAEFNDYLQYWLGKVDSVVKAVRTNNFGDRSPEYPYFIEEKNILPCLMPWVNLCIRPKGNISLPCSFDLLGTSRLNAETHSLKEIWRSEELQLWRKRFLTPNDVKVKQFCKNCKNCVAPSIEEQTDTYQVIYTPAMATFLHKN